ncbi:YebC-like protein [Rhizopogon vinicolor AM-OR11-026]|uniref:YebC-like protein n=1 Tax=Rhizopogon vinicolor AM-OR11-026 TaxID=1314800 RepID=A0A1B7MLW7_9AGAM|nr:YebC-like protein [Rhizopogon vinicolor AM-OR11-026]
MLCSRLLAALPRVSPCTRSFSKTSIPLSGHNKWSKIKQRKGAEDAKKSILYGKAARDILAAARNGGSPIPEENSMLATAMRRAKDAGVPKENIENALLKASKSKNDNGQAVTYEAMMHGSVGIIVECRTNNINRTLSNVRETLNRHGARQAPVKFMFHQRGYLKIAIDSNDIEDLFNAAESTQCAFDFDEWEDPASSSSGIELSCSPDELPKLGEALRQYVQRNAKAERLVSEVRWAPLEDQGSTEDEKDSVSTLVEALEEDEDVTCVSTSLEYSPLLGNA